jgi:uncharacterized membrane protein (UPF0182 family)
MYTIALIVLVGAGIWLAFYSIRHRKFALAGAGIVLAITAGAFFVLLNFWAEMLWFEAMGYGRRFWEAVWVQVLASLAGALFGAAFVYLLTIGASRARRIVRTAGVCLGGLIGLLQGASNWEIILKFIHRAPTQLRDPIFEKPVGFYLIHLISSRKRIRSSGPGAASFRNFSAAGRICRKPWPNMCATRRICC